MYVKDSRLDATMVELLHHFMANPSRPWTGQELMDATGLPAGTLYLHLAKLERSGWLLREREGSDVQNVSAVRRVYRPDPDAASAVAFDFAALSWGLELPGWPSRAARDPSQATDSGFTFMIGWAAAVLLAIVEVLASVSGSLRDEMRAWAERLPELLVRMAAKRLPPDYQDDRAEEWTAELRAVIQDTGAPLSRFAAGVRFAAELRGAASDIGVHLANYEFAQVCGRLGGIGLNGVDELAGLQWVDTPDFGDAPEDRRIKRCYDLDPAPLARLLAAVLNNHPDKVESQLSQIAADDRDGPVHLVHLLGACEKAAADSGGGLPGGSMSPTAPAGHASSPELPILATLLRREGLAAATRFARQCSPTKRYNILKDLLYYALAPVAYLRTGWTNGADPDPLIAYVRAAVSGSRGLVEAMEDIANDDQYGAVHIVHLLMACDRSVRETGGHLPGADPKAAYVGTNLLGMAISPGLPQVVKTLHTQGHARAVSLVRQLSPEARKLMLDAMLMYFPGAVSKLRIDIHDDVLVRR